MSSKNEKTRYSEKELAQFEVIIDQKLEKANELLKNYLEQISEIGTGDNSRVRGLDDGVGTRQNQNLYSMAGRQRKLIQHLENAKIRIKNKVYGVCRQTGKLISKERLKAVPHATLSIGAKQQQIR